MVVRLRFFASLRERLGAEMTRQVPRGSTVEAVWDAIAAEHPDVARTQVRFAVAERYVEPDYVVSAGDEVAVFPPVSGGR
jgi:molybdopterin synthase sulfur carrier subunit